MFGNFLKVDGCFSYMECNTHVRVLAISGSLRKSSSNTALLAAAAKLAPSDVKVCLFAGLGELPPFNPDLDRRGAPESVSGFRRTLNACDAILISSPEYAHGVPGVLKNALDWIVGSGELLAKPIGVINASARATHAWGSLVETLTVMSADVIVDASIVIPLQGRTLDADGIASDAALSTLLSSAVVALANAARHRTAHLNFG
jgi:chromate reductase, NAD(P)H dehydrogenase (quinone)